MGREDGAEMGTLHGHIERGWGMHGSQGLLLRRFLMVLAAGVCWPWDASSIPTLPAPTFPGAPLGHSRRFHTCAPAVAGEG